MEHIPLAIKVLRRNFPLPLLPIPQSPTTQLGDNPTSGLLNGQNQAHSGDGWLSPGNWALGVGHWGRIPSLIGESFARHGFQIRQRNQGATKIAPSSEATRLGDC